MAYKIPQSVLVVIHTADLRVLLLRRADTVAEYWQSVTGSRQSLDEPLVQTALREVREETGIDGRAVGCRLTDWHRENVFPLDPRWKWRYAPAVTHNTEHVFGLLVPDHTPIHLNPPEHTQLTWLPWRAAADRCFSTTNARACLMLPEQGATES